MYEELIKEALEKIETDKSLPGLKDFQVFLMNVEELELFDGATDKIELEDVFPAFKKDIREGFLSIVQKVKGKSLKNRFLDETYVKFWHQIITSKDSGRATD